MGDFQRVILPQGDKSSKLPSGERLPRAEALRLLTKENEVRFSKELLAQLTLDNNRNLHLIHNAKLQMLAECGYEPVEESFKMLMAQRFHYRDDPEFAKCSVYMRLNARRQGSLRQGISEYPNVPLWTIDGVQTELRSSVKGKRPLMILAGSLT